MFIPIIIRAPLLTAIALIEIGMQKENAVNLIKSTVKGSLNVQQNEGLLTYKKVGIKKKNNDACCAIF